jgi:hypothetical protein
MPVLARFYGIVIKMFFAQSEHNPPHIHSTYGEYVGVIDIQTGEMLEGDLPPKALDMVREWTIKHQNELMTIWNTQEFKTLPPLE